MEIINAIQYLKSSGFADNKSNTWINPILHKALNNELNNDDIDNLISSISKMDINPENINDTNSSTAAVAEEVIDTDSKITISEIKEICEVNNFGLLNVKEPIKLNRGLNIFYGMNGVGKSSLYKSICGALGNEKKCVPNVDGNNAKMCSKLKVVCKSGSEEILEFTPEKKDSLDIRIFDSYVSNYIVNSDQENEFQVPYLKQEYFSLLRDLLDTISNRLFSERNTIYNRISEITQIFNKKLDFLYQGYSIIDKFIKEVKYTDEDRQLLEDLRKTKLHLESDTTKVILQSYNDRLSEIDKILKKLCTTTVVENVPTYSIKFNSQFIQQYKENLKNYLKSKELFECNNINKIGEYLPKYWINKQEWYAFIESGIIFVSTLTGDDKKLYSDNKCPFCNQDLSDLSRELVKSYNNLKNTFKADMDKYKASIDNVKKDIADVLNFIEELDKIIIKAFDTIKGIDDKQINNINSSDIKTYLENVKNSMDKYEVFEAKDINTYISSINRIIEFRAILNNRISVITRQISDKGKEIENLASKIKPLETSKTIIENTPILNELVSKLKIVEDIDSKTSNVTSLKSALSKYQNGFSNDSIMKMFKEKLYEEYEELNFQPPKKLIIKPKKNIRLCRIGDYKVSDIYSEGELKVHSLAEFFAIGEIDNYKGVYIFDDPVNSLDYDRMDYVKDRILRLVRDGNQVLIFTHNIYFLYSLMESKITDRVNEVIKGDYEIQVINDTSFGKDKEFSDKKRKIDSKMRDFSKVQDKGQIDKVDLSTVYDLMSGCLESYVELKILSGFISRYRPNIRMDSLDILKNLDNDKIDKINNLYRKTSRYGNRHDRPIEGIPPKYDELCKHYEKFKEIVN